MLAETEPHRVRLGDTGDEDDLLDMAQEAHQESGLRDAGGNPIALDMDMIQSEVRRALTRNRSNLPSWFGVIGTPGDLRASVFLACETPWHSSHVLLVERWLYVRPAFRKSTIATSLIEFAKQSADAARIYPLIAGHISSNREAAKSRFYRRHLTPLGAYYTYHGSDAVGAR